MCRLQCQGRRGNKFDLSLYLLHSADGSGTIDREELAPLFQELGIFVSSEVEREVFPRLDLDCSGDIRRKELATWLGKVKYEL